MYLVFTRMPRESYRRRSRSSLVYFCYVFWALINSLACWLSNSGFAPNLTYTHILHYTLHSTSVNCTRRETLVHSDPVTTATWGRPRAVRGYIARCGGEGAQRVRCLFQARENRQKELTGRWSDQLGSQQPADAMHSPRPRRHESVLAPKATQ